MNLMKCLWALLIFCAISVAHGNDTTPPQCGVALPKKTLQPLSADVKLPPTSTEFKSAATNIYNIKHNCPGGADKNFYASLEDHCDRAADQMKEVEKNATKNANKAAYNPQSVKPFSFTQKMTQCITDYNNWVSLSNAASPFVASWCGQKQGVAPKGAKEFPHYGEMAREFRAAAKKCNEDTHLKSHLMLYAQWCDWTEQQGDKSIHHDNCISGYKKLYNPWAPKSGWAVLGRECERIPQGTDSACACMNKYTAGKWDLADTLNWLKPQSIVTNRPGVKDQAACDSAITAQSPTNLRKCQDIQACCKLLNSDSACPTQ